MTATVTADVEHVDIDQLTIGLDFRLDDDGDALAELAMSIAELGVLQPIIVRRTADGLEVVAGRRRLAASRIAGADTIPCKILDLTDDQAADIALAENVHRRDLSAIEEALAFARLHSSGVTQTEIARRVGRSISHVSLLLKLLDLPDELQGRVHRRETSYRTAIDLFGRNRTRGQRGGGQHQERAERRRRRDRHPLAATPRPAPRRHRPDHQEPPRRRPSVPAATRTAVRARPAAASRTHPQGQLT